MAVTSEFEEYSVERLNLFGPTVARRMFGGLGFFHQGLMFALASNNVLYFKVSDLNREDFEKAGMGPFRPYEGKPYSMSYFELPIEVLEDDEQLPIWAGKAFSVAKEASKKSKKVKKQKNRTAK